MTVMPAALRGAAPPDIERQPEHILRIVRRTEGAYYNQKHADWAASYFPRYLRHFEGEWGGKPLQLSAWQEFEIVRPLFGWKRPDGTRIFRRLALWIGRKNGKALALNTLIATPSGWSTMGGLRPGDIVFSENGQPCRVTHESPVYLGNECFEVEFSNGEVIVADAEHLWLTKARIDRPGAGPVSRKGYANEPLKTRVRTTRELSASLHCGGRGDRNHSIAMPVPLELPERPLPVDPYLLGVWLGDGGAGTTIVHSGDADREEMTAAIEACGYAVTAIQGQSGWKLQVRAVEQSLFGNSVAGKRSPRNLQIILRGMGILSEKRIPPDYLRASKAQRIALLQGLLDTDGFVSKFGRQIELTTVSEDLAGDYGELLASLGVKFGIRQQKMRCGGREVKGRAHRVFFWPDFGEIAPFRLARKVAGYRELMARRTSGVAPRSRTVQIVDIRRVPSVPVKCITVDAPSKLYLAGKTMIPTHNSLLMAGLGSACFTGGMEPGCKIYCLCAKKEQAEIVFKGAVLMIQNSPDLNSRLDTFKTKILYPEINGVWVPLSGKAGGKHGLNAHMKLGDELHEWTSGDLDDFVRQSMAARRQPLEIDVSTAGDIRGYGYEVFQRDQRILEGVIEDPETLIALYAASPDDDWQSPEVWKKANPNLDISVKRTFLEAEARKALDDPAKETHFRRYHLNLWTQAGTRMIPAHKWAPCCDAEDGWKGMLQRFKGRAAFAGIDLSSNTDWSAVVWIMPPSGGDPKTRVHCRFYIPRANWDLRKRRDKVNLDRWEKMGCLRVTEGDTIDYDVIFRDTLEDAALLQVRGIGLDRKFANWIGPKLLEQYGEEIVKYIGQSFSGMGPGYKEINRLIEGGPSLFDHGGHPVLKWMASNVAGVVGRDGDILAIKDKSADRIDGIVALAMAEAMAVGAEIPVTSVYETRGLIVL